MVYCRVISIQNLWRTGNFKKLCWLLMHAKGTGSSFGELLRYAFLNQVTLKWTNTISLCEYMSQMAIVQHFFGRLRRCECQALPSDQLPFSIFCIRPFLVDVEGM